MTNHGRAPTGELSSVSRVNAAEQSAGEPTGRLVTIDEFFTSDPEKPARVWHNIVTHFAPGGMLFAGIEKRPYFHQFLLECPELNSRLVDVVSKFGGVFKRIEDNSEARKDLHNAYLKMKEFGGHDKNIFNFGFDTLKD